MHLGVSKSRASILAFITLLLGFSGISCLLVKPDVLEFGQVMQYQLELDPNTKVPKRISGFCGASAYCVRDITTKTNNACLIILVEVGFCKDGQTGNFSYPITVGDNINEIRFGMQEHLLWQRSNLYRKIDTPVVP